MNAGSPGRLTVKLGEAKNEGSDGHFYQGYK